MSTYLSKYIFLRTGFFKNWVFLRTELFIYLFLRTGCLNFIYFIFIFKNWIFFPQLPWIFCLLPSFVIYNLLHL